MRVSNRGPSTARNAVAVLVLPDGVSLVSAAGATCTVSGPVVTCALGDMVAAASVTIALVVAVAASATGPVTANVAVSSDASDPNSADNIASKSSAVLDSADLGVVLSHGFTVLAGSTVRFAARISNTGPRAATAILATFALPAGLTFASSTQCAEAAGVITCAIEALASGASQFVGLWVAVDPTLTDPVVVAVTLSSATTDPNLANNSIADSFEVVTRANLGVSLSHPGSFLAGAAGTYSMRIVNGGPSVARNATAALVLPAGLSFVSASGATCTATGPTVACVLGDLAPSASVSITIAVAVAIGASGTATATVTVSSDTADPSAANNVATNSSQVLWGADLSVALSHSGAVTAGAPTTFTALVRNYGPTAAADLVVTFTLAPGLTFRSGSGCTATGATVTCLVASLTSGSSRSVSISLAVAPALTGSLVVSATVTSATADPVASNNTAADAVSVQTSANLGLSLSRSGSFHSGSTGVLTVKASNTGPSDAADVVVTIVLPTGLAFVSVAGASCVATGQVAVCTLGSLAAATSAAFALTVAVTGTGAVTTTAAVASSNH
ncbi:MAG: domain containing protein [Jatrophihabitantaceae bacterium]|nr:domain containing protein [Jatrophihabitantaceae bacterium]